MDRRGVQDGMKVQSSDGKSLGKVVSCGDASFMIEKGFFFPKDYTAGYDAVARIDRDQVWLTVSAEALQAGIIEAASPEVPMTKPAAESSAPAGASAEVRVPLAEEQVSVEKRIREAGRVDIRKEVVTEQKQVTVPVTREEVQVERVPAGPEAQAAEPGAFQSGKVSVPVMEEEVEIKKRPVVREEVRVSKTPRQGEVRAETEVRKEEARIGKEGDIGPTKGEPDEEP